jgi:hypothetical protein
VKANCGNEANPYWFSPSAHALLTADEGRAEWKAAGGVLFGVSDAISDFTYKFDEVEF